MFVTILLCTKNYIFAKEHRLLNQERTVFHGITQIVFVTKTEYNYYRQNDITSAY